MSIDWKAKGEEHGKKVRTTPSAEELQAWDEFYRAFLAASGEHVMHVRGGVIELAAMDFAVEWDRAERNKRELAR